MLLSKLRSEKAALARELADQDSVVRGLREEVGQLRRDAAVPDSWLERVTVRKVLVHQRNDASIEGLLVGVYVDGLVLRAAAMLRSGADPTPMAGEVFIPRDQVALVQSDG